MRKIIINSSLIILTFCALFFVAIFLLNPFDFGPCDGNGPSNGERKYYYDNGQIKEIGQVKDCAWDGLVKGYYESGEIEYLSNYQFGTRNGLTLYFTKDSFIWRQELFHQGDLLESRITDLFDSSIFFLKKDTLKLLTKNHSITVPFKLPTTLFGFDKPFTSLHNGKLIIRGAQDFYVVNKKLELELNLRDTLNKYIPSAYVTKIDNSGNKHTFLWHRDILGDSLKIKVFYDGDSSQSFHKIWEQVYKLGK